MNGLLDAAQYTYLNVKPLQRAVLPMFEIQHVVGSTQTIGFEVLSASIRVRLKDIRIGRMVFCSRNEM
jgi:hypothetical protein